MKLILVIAIILSFNSQLNAQNFATINNNRDFVNIRQDKSTSSKVIAKLYPSSIFSVDLEEEKNAEWVKIYAESREGVLQGYVQKRSIIFLSSFKHLKTHFNGSNFATVKNDSIAITVNATVFIAKNHKLTLSKSGGTYYEKIDNKPIWGTDGNLPKKAIARLSITLNSRPLPVPQSALSNLFEPNLSTLTVYFGNANTLYIRMDNSDGAGGYTVIWVIKNGKYLRRFLDNSEA